ncbi:MAG: carbohydrate binding family 9 domain-containing protein [Gammaproteobacteria bacterium]|nr:carbohydrate binding family 9 domain-containing protein [Gammaproteobacteria bacterium]
MHLGRLFLSSIIILSGFGASAISEKTTYDMPRVTKAPKIDGHLSEGEWKQAKQVKLHLETYPAENLPAPVETTAYMMEDGEYIYFAFDAKDNEPDNIRAYFRDRDQIFQDDFVGVIFDPFNADRRAFEFFVNPLGAQGDLTRDDTRNNEDSSWNTLWESAGQMKPDGYQVEIAVPYRSIRFPSGLAKQQWGIQFLRIYPREARKILSDSPNDRDLSCSICQYHKVEGFQNLTSSDHFELTPTLTLSQEETRDPITTNDWDSENNSEVGLDARWAISEDWIANATINPDFSQVEADAAQLNVNTTFALFFQEARPFFLEGQDYFQSHNNLVHTRSIAEPDYGSKVTGKTNGTTYAFLGAHDSQTSFILPGAFGSDLAVLDDTESSVFIGRVQNEFGNKSNIGLTLTHRSADDYLNQVAAVDSTYYFNESNYVKAQWMHSTSENPESIVTEFSVDPVYSDDALTVNYRHRKRDYTIYIDYLDFGEDFRADLGFISRVNFRKLVVGGEHRWFNEDKKSPWTRWFVSGDVDRTEDQQGRKLEEEVEAYFGINGPKEFFIRTGLLTREQLYNDVYFSENSFSTWFEFRPYKDLWLGHFLRVGDQIDFNNTRLGEIKLFEPQIKWQVGQHFTIRYDGLIYDLKVDADDDPNQFAGEHYKANIANLRLTYQFDLRSKLRFTNQYSQVKYESTNETDKTLGWQLLFSYKVNPQSLFFLGYSSYGFEESPLDEITESQKTLFAKFSYVLQS